ncbi:zinc finger protein [Salpingoeca rosetta]|uniref:Zinc finger protein n=1 Tax=Salpingoeca rosetta (strain ATCC 50818 / BSB-021) TaxID=946362 RepID=F2TWG9_SALR5|nr:zinc finger protein [Salpingoeca rosetta]EGD72415.1 zinc finger protein [Salpingoeca rosetta]|eukprot:XP_004998984.1 zinc finger protein [Salpingoeca rosetta]
MGNPQRRKRMHKNNKFFQKAMRTRRKTRDVDQIHDDLKPKVLNKLATQVVDYDLPGMGQFYCVHCARHFVDEFTLEAHRRSKVHKRRLKQLSETPYTQKEADAAGGLGVYVPPSKVDVDDVSVVQVRKDVGMETDEKHDEAAPPTLDDIKPTKAEQEEKAKMATDKEDATKPSE